MKKMYTSPEVSLICFQATEHLASVISFDDILDKNIYGLIGGDGSVHASGDIDVQT